MEIILSICSKLLKNLVETSLNKILMMFLKLTGFPSSGFDERGMSDGCQTVSLLAPMALAPVAGRPLTRTR